LGLGDTQDWTISGFMSETQLSFVPSKLSAEGLAKFLENNEPAREAEASLNYVFKRWVVAVDTLFTKGVVSVIRRDALGRPRHESRSGLPVSWNVE
jgi:CRISPR-associated endonuclease Csn1